VTCRNPSRFAAAMSEGDAPFPDFSAGRSGRARLAAASLIAGFRSTRL
jgi:hypothetical protein